MEGKKERGSGERERGKWEGKVGGERERWRVREKRKGEKRDGPTEGDGLEERGICFMNMRPNLTYLLTYLLT